MPPIVVISWFLLAAVRSNAAGPTDSPRPKARRRPPASEQEQARRKEWGARWGKLVAEGYKRLTQEMGNDE